MHTMADTVGVCNFMGVLAHLLMELRSSPCPPASASSLDGLQAKLRPRFWSSRLA